MSVWAWIASIVGASLLLPAWYAILWLSRRFPSQDVYRWHKWFAWYPVDTLLGPIWLKTIWRKMVFNGTEDWALALKNPDDERLEEED